jgi:hypothetical protein
MEFGRIKLKLGRFLKLLANPLIKIRELLRVPVNN